MRKQLILALALAPLTLQGNQQARIQLGEHSATLSFKMSRVDALSGQLQGDLEARDALKASVAQGKEVMRETRKDEAALTKAERGFISLMLREAKTAGDRALNNQEALLAQLDKLLASPALSTLKKELPKLSETLGKLQKNTAALSTQ